MGQEGAWVGRWPARPTRRQEASWRAGGCCAWACMGYQWAPCPGEDSQRQGGRDGACAPGCPLLSLLPPPWPLAPPGPCCSRPRPSRRAGLLGSRHLLSLTVSDAHCHLSSPRTAFPVKSTVSSCAGGGRGALSVLHQAGPCVCPGPGILQAMAFPACKSSQLALWPAGGWGRVMGVGWGGGRGGVASVAEAVTVQGLGPRASWRGGGPGHSE